MKPGHIIFSVQYIILRLLRLLSPLKGFLHQGIIDLREGINKILAVIFSPDGLFLLLLVGIILSFSRGPSLITSMSEANSLNTQGCTVSNAAGDVDITIYSPNAMAPADVRQMVFVLHNKTDGTIANWYLVVEEDENPNLLYPKSSVVALPELLPHAMTSITTTLETPATFKAANIPLQIRVYGYTREGETVNFMKNCSSITIKYSNWRKFALTWVNLPANANTMAKALGYLVAILTALKGILGWPLNIHTLLAKITNPDSKVSDER